MVVAAPVVVRLPAAAGVQQVVAGPSPQRITREATGCVVQAVLLAEQLVVAGTAREAVAARTPTDAVVAVHAEQDVVPLEPHDDVASWRPREQVVGRRPDDGRRYAAARGLGGRPGGRGHRHEGRGHR